MPLVGVGVTLLGKEIAVGVSVTATTVVVRFSCGTVVKVDVGGKTSGVKVNVSVAGAIVTVGGTVLVSVGMVVGDAMLVTGAGDVGINPHELINSVARTMRTVFFMMP